MVDSCLWQADIVQWLFVDNLSNTFLSFSTDKFLFLCIPAMPCLEHYVWCLAVMSKMSATTCMWISGSGSVSLLPWFPETYAAVRGKEGVYSRVCSTDVFVTKYTLSEPQWERRCFITSLQQVDYVTPRVQNPFYKPLVTGQVTSKISCPD